MKRIASFVAVLAFLVTALFGLGAAAQQGAGMGMGTPMAGEAQGMSMGAFYMTITNTGDTADRLVSANTDVAETIEIHNVVMDGGVMQMMPQFDGVEVPAKGELVLEPGGYHVMLIGLTRSLLDGDTFEATLTFENAGDVTVTVPVFMGEPDGDELTAEPVEAGDLVIDGIWARQAPKLDDNSTGMMASPSAECPMGTPGAGMGPGGMQAGECPYGTPMADCPSMTGTPGAGMGPGGMHAGACPYGTPVASPMAGQGPMGGMAQGEQQGMSMGAFYMTITNTGDMADRLVSVTTDVAETVEIHNVVMDGGVMQMVPQFDGVDVPAGGELVLEPGGYHVMLIGLTESLLAGDEFNATLTFENAGEVEVTVPVMMGEPDADELTAEPVEAGDLVIEGIWARQAPKIDAATPAS